MQGWGWTLRMETKIFSLSLFTLDTQLHKVTMDFIGRALDLNLKSNIRIRLKNVSDGIVRGVTRDDSDEHTLSHLAESELKFREHKESINQKAGTREDLSWITRESVNGICIFIKKP